MITGSPPGEFQERLDSGISHLREVARILAVLYGTPDLGNKPDPTDELVYIILARKTREGAYQQGFNALRQSRITLQRRRRGPAHRSARIDRRIEFVAECCAKRFLIALGDTHAVDDRRPQVFGLAMLLQRFVRDFGSFAAKMQAWLDGGQWEDLVREAEAERRLPRRTRWPPIGPPRRRISVSSRCTFLSASVSGARA